MNTKADFIKENGPDIDWDSLDFIECEGCEKICWGDEHHHIGYMISWAGHAEHCPYCHPELMPPDTRTDEEKEFDKEFDKAVLNFFNPGMGDILD